MKDELNVGGFTEMTEEETQMVDGGDYGIIGSFIWAVGSVLVSCLGFAASLFTGKNVT